jgi:ATP phosphoribosyltransferase regulatory subunit HisZ
MRGRTKRLAIVVVLTIADVATGNYDCGVIWEAYARDPARASAKLGRDSNV